MSTYKWMGARYDIGCELCSFGLRLLHFDGRTTVMIRFLNADAVYRVEREWQALLKAVVGYVACRENKYKALINLYAGMSIASAIIFCRVNHVCNSVTNLGLSWHHLVSRFLRWKSCHLGRNSSSSGFLHSTVRVIRESWSNSVPLSEWIPQGEVGACDACHVFRLL